MRNTQSIEESVRHSDIVYNLVGRMYPTKYASGFVCWICLICARNFTLEDVHVEGAERIAEAVAKYDIDRFVHVSSYNASKDSPSEFFRTKARGEEVVRSIYPETTIVRPAPMFGFEDSLLHRLASATNVFTSNNMQERFWPVHAPDVGAALEKMIEDDNTASQTYELYGPRNYSMKEISQLVDREIIKQRRHINIPKIIAKPVSETLNKLLWWHVGSGDEIEREFIDQEIDKRAKTFGDLGINEPADLKGLTFHYLVRCVDRFTNPANICNSKITGARHIQIYHQQPNESDGKNGSIYTFMMISDLWQSLPRIGLLAIVYRESETNM